MRSVLVIDVGGHNVKIGRPDDTEPRKIPSGPEMTPGRMVEAVLQAADWAYEVIAMGYPAPVRDNRPVQEPHNLGPGWVGFDFAAAFGKPVRIVNDAAMQALGSYQGGRMLFLGLGTGLGSALVIEGTLQPLELAHLPYRKDRTYEDYAGVAGYHRMGVRKWTKHVHRIVHLLQQGLQAEYVVLGGGQTRKLESIPEGVLVGDNANALVGGGRLWDERRGMRKKTGKNREKAGKNGR